MLKNLSATLLAAAIALTPTTSLSHHTQKSLRATYYSPSLQGRLMANGKRYNKNAFTAAVREGVYKLGTRVVVTHGSVSTVVTITDRCHCGIDLSEAAFKRLNKGSLTVGVLNVKVRVADTSSVEDTPLNIDFTSSLIPDSND